MSQSQISVGLQIGTQPPLGLTTTVARYARLSPDPPMNIVG
jgi:hypothetical protein